MQTKLECFYVTYKHSQRKTRKDLRWFEETFVVISGEEQLLQPEKFAVAVHTDEVRC